MSALAPARRRSTLLGLALVALVVATALATLTMGRLGMALTEGAANDWVALAITDGYQAPAHLGAIGYALKPTSREELEDVFRKLAADLEGKVDEPAIRAKMAELRLTARQQILHET